MSVFEKANEFIREAERLEAEQYALAKQREKFEEEIAKLEAQNRISKEDLEIATNAIAILQCVSDEAVQESYKFIEENLNIALERVFANRQRKVKLKESLYRGQYPQLEVQVTVDGGVKCKLKNVEHGLTQVISLLSILCLTVITGMRRLVVLDEVLSGLSASARKAMSDIFWTFTEIGFQFVITDHGFIPKGAKVIQMDTTKAMGDAVGVSYIKDEYIEQNGVYLDGKFLDEENGEAELTM